MSKGMPNNLPFTMRGKGGWRLLPGLNMRAVGGRFPDELLAGAKNEGEWRTVGRAGPLSAVFPISKTVCHAEGTPEWTIPTPPGDSNLGESGFCLLCKIFRKSGDG